jgi:hypothetical protein
MGIRVRVKLLVEGREVETAALVNSGFERAARGRAAPEGVTRESEEPQYWR